MLCTNSEGSPVSSYENIKVLNPSLETRKYLVNWSYSAIGLSDPLSNYTVFKWLLRKCWFCPREMPRTGVDNKFKVVHGVL